MPEGKRTELIRVGLSKEGMTLERLYKVLELAETKSSDTIRTFNGNLIIERPAE